MRHLEKLGLAVAGAVVGLLVGTGPVIASTNGQPPITLPEPGTLTLLAAGVAAVTVGARWFRRK